MATKPEQNKQEHQITELSNRIQTNFATINQNLIALDELISEALSNLETLNAKIDSKQYLEKTEVERNWIEKSKVQAGLIAHALLVKCKDQLGTIVQSTTSVSTKTSSIKDKLLQSKNRKFRKN